MTLRERLAMLFFGHSWLGPLTSTPGAEGERSVANASWDRMETARERLRLADDRLRRFAADQDQAMREIRPLPKGNP